MERELERSLRERMDAFPAKTALYCADLTSGETIAAIREDTQVVSASTIKVAVLLTALDLVQRGELSLEWFIPILPKDLCPDTCVFEPEYRRDGASLWELLYWMMVQSDNTATNAVLSLLTFDAVNRYCDRLGLTATRAERKMLDFEAVARGRNNYTSPLDQYRMYEQLYHGKLLKPSLQAVALDFLGRCRSFDSLQRYLPQAVTVLHKPGGLDHLNHDAGIFLTKEPYFLGVFTWDGPALDGQPQQMRLIGQLSRMVYDNRTGGAK